MKSTFSSASLPVHLIISLTIFQSMAKTSELTTLFPMPPLSFQELGLHVHKLFMNIGNFQSIRLQRKGKGTSTSLRELKNVLVRINAFSNFAKFPSTPRVGILKKVKYRFASFVKKSQSIWQLKNLPTGVSPSKPWMKISLRRWNDILLKTQVQDRGKIIWGYA